MAQVVPESFAQFVQQLFVVRSGCIKFRLRNFTLQKSFSCRPGIFLRNGCPCPAIADWISIYPIYPKCTLIHNTQKSVREYFLNTPLLKKLSTIIIYFLFIFCSQFEIPSLHIVTQTTIGTHIYRTNVIYHSKSNVLITNFISLPLFLYSLSLLLSLLLLSLSTPAEYRNNN